MSAGGVVAAAEVAAAEVLIQAVILPGVVVRARLTLIAPGTGGIETSARIIAPGAGVTTREIAAGIAALLLLSVAGDTSVHIGTGRQGGRAIKERSVARHQGGQAFRGPQARWLAGDRAQRIVQSVSASVP